MSEAEKVCVWERGEKKVRTKGASESSGREGEAQEGEGRRGQYVNKSAGC